jgi:hypothetical protein
LPGVELSAGVLTEAGVGRHLGIASRLSCISRLNVRIAACAEEHRRGDEKHDGTAFPVHDPLLVSAGGLAPTPKGKKPFPVCSLIDETFHYHELATIQKD